MFPSSALLYQPVLDENGKRRTVNQQTQFLRAEHNLLARHLAEIPGDPIKKALYYLESNALRRSDTQLTYARWLLAVHQRRDQLEGQRRHNYLWRVAATAPPGYCHIKKGLLGTLIEDIINGLPFEQLKGRFEYKADPTRFRHSTTAPTDAQLKSAERIVDELGIAASLPRRYAQLSDIGVPWLWRPGQAKKRDQMIVETSASQAETRIGGVFGHLSQKTAETAPIIDGIPAQPITFDKFRRLILPRAERLEVQIPQQTSRFAALTTAQDASSPPILQWDDPKARNPFAWYYEAGTDAEIRERVTAAGGRYEDAEIRCSLIWHNRTDLDLHCITPRGEHIYFGAKQARCGGWLDVDMNVGGETTKPIENIAWERGKALAGRYRFYVLNFCDRNDHDNPYVVELSVGGEVHRIEGVHREDGHGSSVSLGTLVFEFDYQPGKPIVLYGNGGTRKLAFNATVKSSTGANSWNVQPGAFVDATALVLSPNLWSGGDELHRYRFRQHGQHVFFLLSGCRDLQAGRGRGFFVEHLRGELHAARKTLEAYAKTAVIAGAETADACGIGMSADLPEWQLVVRAHTHNTGQLYRIDRWD